MFCKECGEKLGDGAKFCPRCGKSVISATNFNSSYTGTTNYSNKKISVNSNKQFITSITIAIVSSILLFIIGLLFAYSVSGSDGEVFGMMMAVFGGVMFIFSIVAGIIRASVEKMPMQHRLCRVIEKVGPRTVIVEFDNGTRETFNVVREIILSVGDVGIIGYKYKLISEYERK
jgi:ribosomal protein S27AE